MNLENHPNGFLKIHKDDDPFGEKIHIFSYRFPKQDVYTGVHNHRFSFHSEIIAGELKNVRYRIAPVRQEAATHHVWKPDMSNNGALAPTGVWVSAQIASVEYLKAGDSYSMQVGEFHEARADFAITRFNKTVIDEALIPSVLVPIGETPDNGFQRLIIPL